jgi:hypothetical protein
MTLASGRGDVPQKFFSWPFRWDGNQISFLREDAPDTFIGPDGVTSAVQTWATDVLPA